jgi:prepilin-type processing-associated H-X9-DG protein
MKRFLTMACKSTFMALLVLTVTSAAMAQTKLPDNLYEALNRQGVSATLNANDLSADWHIISAGELGFFGLAMSNEIPFQLYFYTKGEMISFGTEKYLVAYHVQNMPDDDSDNMPPSYYRPYKKKGYLLQDAKLALSLLPLDASQSIYEIKQFNPQTDYIQKDVISEQSSLSNLKQIALATFMYVQDYDEKLPPMVAARSADEINEHFSGKVTAKTPVQNRLMPYIKSKTIFLQPATHRPYLPNYKVSRLPDSKIDNPVATFLFYEDAPNSAGKRAVAYADGHVKLLTEAEFQKERKAQGISESGYPSAAKPVHKTKSKAVPHQKAKKPGTY